MFNLISFNENDIYFLVHDLKRRIYYEILRELVMIQITRIVFIKTIQIIQTFQTRCKTTGSCVKSLNLVT